MDVNKVRNFNWEPIEDPHSIIGNVPAGTYIKENDLDTLVNTFLYDIAGKLQVTCDELLSIVKDKNQEYFMMKKALYSDYQGLSANSKTLFSLLKLLKVPHPNEPEN